jgi:hypothetical protein
VVGLGDEFSVLFQAAVHLSPAVNRALLQALLFESSSRELPLPPSLVPFLLPCLLFSFFLLFFLFLQGRGRSVQGAMLVYPRGGCGNAACCLFAHLLVPVSLAGLELVSGSTRFLLFSESNVVLRSLNGLGVQDISVMLIPGFFFFSFSSAK